MAWEKASLKLVFMTDEQLPGGNFRMKSKSFSNLKQGATTVACEAVADALEPLQQYMLVEIMRVDTDLIRG